jgi:hypothetical protein
MVQPTSLAAEYHDLTESTSSRLATWLKASVVDLAPTRRMRLAWMGRTSHDEVQDPTISLPRQLRACHAVLSEDMEIGLHFWDVETSRKDLDARGSSTAWKNFDIPSRATAGSRTCSPKRSGRIAGSMVSSASRSTGSPG